MPCKCYRIVLRCLEGMICIGILEEIRFFMWNTIFLFGKLSWRKYANSENFANSEITPEDFANSEPGSNFSVFSRTVISSLGSVVAIGGCFHNLLYNQHFL